MERYLFTLPSFSFSFHPLPELQKAENTLTAFTAFCISLLIFLAKKTTDQNLLPVSRSLC